jgi:hypothetical protein
MTEPSTPFNWAVQEILQERHRQDKKWGAQHHSHLVWQTIALEEFGEIAEAELENRSVKNELVQTAAVLVAWLEDTFERGLLE